MVAGGRDCRDDGESPVVTGGREDGESPVVTGGREEMVTVVIVVVTGGRGGCDGGRRW